MDRRSWSWMELDGAGTNSVLSIFSTVTVLQSIFSNQDSGTGDGQVECNLSARIFTGTSGPNVQTIGPPGTRIQQVGKTQQ
jgi:hypothetical protein